MLCGLPGAPRAVLLGRDGIRHDDVVEPGKCMQIKVLGLSTGRSRFGPSVHSCQFARTFALCGPSSEER
jgi:hypothetical protein